MREQMIALLCKPREIESSQQIVALKCLGKMVASTTDVVLSRVSLKLLDKYCTELGLVNEPVILQSETYHKAKINSILGKGVRPVEVALWWILGELFFSFLKFETLALLIVPSLAKNLPYFGKDMDFSLAYNMEAGAMDSIQF
jgi:hypothetical protein